LGIDLIRRKSGQIAFVSDAAAGNGKGIPTVLATYGTTIVVADISDQVDEVVGEFKEKGFNMCAMNMHRCFIYCLYC